MPSSAVTGRVVAGTGWAEVCEYCGCREVPPIGELMDEHTALVDQADQVRQDLSGGNPSLARSRLAGLVADLERHVQREEDGIFPVSVVTLGADGWEIIERAHDAYPSFLLDPAVTGPPPPHDEESTCRRSR